MVVLAKEQHVQRPRGRRQEEECHVLTLARAKVLSRGRVEEGDLDCQARSCHGWRFTQ